MVKFLYCAVGETTPRVMDKDLNNCKVFKNVCKSLVHNHTLSSMHDKNNLNRNIYDTNNTFYYAIYNDSFLIDDERPLNVLIISFIIVMFLFLLLSVQKKIETLKSFF
jgi:hypothetical protein